MSTDRFAHNLSKPYYRTYFDRDYNYLKDRQFWLYLLIFSVGFIYAEQRLYVE